MHFSNNIPFRSPKKKDVFFAEKQTYYAFPSSYTFRLWIDNKKEKLFFCGEEIAAGQTIKIFLVAKLLYNLNLNV